MSELRQLTDKEIATLMVYGCSADDWKNISVDTDFSPAFISGVHFSGNVVLGTYNHTFELPGGFRRHSGINNCCLHNCRIGNDVYINRINNYIANYHIGDFSYIENTDSLICDGNSSFGNGVQVSALNESGGRKTAIFDNMSAQLAYIMTIYRHRPVLIQKLEDMIQSYAMAQVKPMGTIGRGVSIINCGKIKNVRIGDGAKLEGASQLNNGSVNSCTQSPVYIGNGVNCTDFIISNGAIIDTSAQVSRCFVGQSVEISMMFTASDSLFFANSQCMQGEAVSVFAGPYTVSHHKSTLLIAGMYSFYNAGSGTNQSNHKYKTGPVHQGILARGSKTSSSSYILWPACAGVFSIIKGRHDVSFDTDSLPFSYILENNGDTYIVPALALRNAGTMRDAKKWPSRDKRYKDLKTDRIHFGLLNPYSISKIVNGIELLQKLIKNSSSDIIIYNGCKIKLSAALRGLKLYKLTVQKYIGGYFLQKLEQTDYSFTPGEIQTGNNGQWVDLAGMFAPADAVGKLLNSIEESPTSVTISETESKLDELFDAYQQLEDAKISGLLHAEKSVYDDNENAISILYILEKGKEATSLLHEMVLNDVYSEFSDKEMTGYGVDGDADTKMADFDQVRGLAENNSFIKEIENESDMIRVRFETAISKIKS